MRRIATLFLALATVLAVLGTDTAAASYDPIVSGSTTIALAKPFSSVLDRHQVKIEVLAGAKRKGSRIVLPTFGGEVDPRLGAGTLENTGTIVFAAGRRKVILRNVEFKAKHAPLYAKVGGGQLKIASCRKLGFKRRGFSTSFDATGLRLTAKVATRLNKKLRLGKTLAGGQFIGRIDAVANPATVHLQEGDRLSLAVDPAFYS